MSDRENWRTRPHASLEERFWMKVQKPDDPDDCWAWTGSAVPSGYGQISLGPRSSGLAGAHRVSYEIHFGPITDGLWVLHRCDNPPCTNPAHLFLGTVKDNARDMIQKGRNNHSNSPRGSKNGNAKLTESEVREIKELLARRVRQPSIAERFKVSLPAIEAISMGKTWRHIPGPDIRIAQDHAEADPTAPNRLRPTIPAPRQEPS